MHDRRVPAAGTMNVGMRFADLVIAIAHPRTVAAAARPSNQMHLSRAGMVKVFARRRVTSL
jgi:hypothetical protein